MSPEHICGANCGRKADIWSYGGVLVEMLTGVPPWFDAAASNNKGHFATFALLSRIVNETGPPPLPPSSELPVGLQDLLLACFARDLAQRPTTTELLSFRWIRGEGGDHPVPPP